MAYFRVISDVHGKFDKYISIAKQAEYTIQIGDMGFTYDALNKLDHEKHRVLAGNHDNYHCVDDKFIFQNKIKLSSNEIENTKPISL